MVVVQEAAGAQKVIDEAPATQKQQQTVEENSVATAIRSEGTAAEFDLYADAVTANGANLEVNVC